MTEKKPPFSLNEALLRDRLKDYQEGGLVELRDRLVAAWKKAHPAASGEASAAIGPLMRTEPHVKRRPDDPDEIWINDVYQVTLRRRPDAVFGSHAGMIQLGVSTHDGTARHDWREFQAIKNQLAGPECEAFELYPADSRLLDPSNYYSLWCFPGVRRIKVGHEERRVMDSDIAVAPQRKLPPGETSDE